MEMCTSLSYVVTDLLLKVENVESVDSRFWAHCGSKSYFSEENSKIVNRSTQYNEKMVKED